MERRVTLYSEGKRVAGILFAPDGVPAGGRRPGIVVCHGYTGVKERYLPDIAARLVAARYVALIFDYRGFGESEGDRGRLIPLDQVEDIRSALSFLEAQPEVDPGRLGLYGTSFGGANVSYVAGIDERVQCTVSVVGVADGERWLRSLRRHWEWEEFRKRVARDRVIRATTGEGEWVDPLEIMLPDPETAAVWDARYREHPEGKFPLALESADAIIRFHPEAVVERIAPRAICWIVAGEDRLVPPSEAEWLYRRAGEPKRLLVIPGASHYAVYSGGPFDEVMHHTIAWFGEHLGDREGGPWP